MSSGNWSAHRLAEVPGTGVEVADDVAEHGDAQDDRLDDQERGAHPDQLEDGAVEEGGVEGEGGAEVQVQGELEGEAGEGLAFW